MIIDDTHNAALHLYAHWAECHPADDSVELFKSENTQARICSRDPWGIESASLVPEDKVISGHAISKRFINPDTES